MESENLVFAIVIACILVQVKALGQSQVSQPPPQEENCRVLTAPLHRQLPKPSLSKDFLGFTVYFDDFDWKSNPLSELLKFSPNLLLENRNLFKFQQELGLKQLLKSLARVAIKAERAISIAVKLNFDENLGREHENFDLQWLLEVYGNITQQALDAAKNANRIFPGIVNRVFLRMDDHSANFRQNNQYFDNLFYQLKRNLTDKYTPKLGISYALTDVWRKQCTSNAIKFPKTPDFVVLQTGYFGMERFKCFSKQRFKSAYISYKRCEDRLRLEMGNDVEALVDVQIFCRNVSMDNPGSLEHYIRILDAVSWESESIRTMLYVNNAFHYENPTANHEETTCGWWNFSLTSESEGVYKIEDRIDVARRSSRFKVPENTFKETIMELKLYLWWILLPIILVVAGFGLICFCILKLRSKCKLENEEIRTFFIGNSRPIEDNITDGCGTALSLKYDREKFEVKRNSYVIDTGRLLGSGEFGSVYAGVIQVANGEIPVAVKTAKSSTGRDTTSAGFTTSLRSLMGEIKILAYIEKHLNIVQLLGANTEKLRNGKVLAFIEFCENGSLFKYLRSLNPNELSVPEDVVPGNETNVYENYDNSIKLDPSLSQKFRKWSLEIAVGMEFLAYKKIVHADLATRNILLDRNNVAKISDFGLSRRLYDYSEYVKKNQEPLPWRWMAPEALKRLEFSEKTDVWAFGVTMWEIYSLADTPYAGMSWTVDFVSQLEAGLKLNMPKYNENEFYSVMIRCWNINSVNRPTFSQVQQLLLGGSDGLSSASKN